MVLFTWPVLPCLLYLNCLWHNLVLLEMFYFQTSYSQQINFSILLNWSLSDKSKVRAIAAFVNCLSSSVLFCCGIFFCIYLTNLRKNIFLFKVNQKIISRKIEGSLQIVKSFFTKHFWRLVNKFCVHCAISCKITAS